MSHTPKRRPVQAFLDPETLRQFKVAAAERGLTMQTILSSAVESFLLDFRRNRQPEASPDGKA